MDVVREKSMSFAIDIVNLYKFLVAEKREFVMSKQILKSGTSIGANLREAKDAQSDLDFIHKNAVSQKEWTKHFIGWSCCTQLIFYPSKLSGSCMIKAKNYCG